jgi:hypothetical protein
MDKLLKELIETESQMLLRFFSVSYFVSEKAYFTFSQRLGIDEAIKYASLERECFIALLMRKMQKTWKLLVRDVDNQVRKIFAVFSDSYTYFPQTGILPVIDAITDELGGVVGDWFINHELTEITVEFPDKAEDGLTPAVRIITSDTGYSSFTIQAVWKKNRHYLIQEEVPVIHRGKNMTKENILKITKEQILPAFADLPERLKKLKSMPVTMPYDDFIKSISKAIGMVKTITKKNEKKAREILMAEYDPDKIYMVYDIVSAFMDLPGKCQIPATYQKSFEKICGKVPFIDYNMQFSTKKITKKMQKY